MPIDQQQIIIKQEVKEETPTSEETEEQAEEEDLLRELQETEAAVKAELDAALREFHEEARERPVRNIKPVKRLQPTTVPGEFNKGQTHAEVAA